ncbi:MAG: Gfo/Idh/MocA family oxidoreductase [Phycisphaerales bacterium]|jgi:predicted dehydrogenase|nr:Gfo/Idh/MocA family oxidoreductase [Phycisphaerales bacterium]
MNHNASQLNRRRFLKTTFASAAGVAILPAIIPSSAIGADGAVAPSDRIVMGTIGCGGRARSDMGSFMNNADVQMLAVCEVQGARRKGAKESVDRRYKNQDCKAYIDPRELLGRSDIDAVLIATGDNNHSMISIEAARAGKDMYCEKPMSVTIAESRAVSDAMKRFSRIFQCGTQRRNVGNFVWAAALARSGKLGEIKTMHAEKAGAQSGVNFTVLPTQPEPAKDVMDWNGWLGPAIWRPYNSQYYSRRFWSHHGDFSGGSICEWGSHTVDICQWAIDADDTSAIDYEVINNKGDVQATYANGVKLIIRKGLRFGTCPVRIEGTEGWVETGDSGQFEVFPKSLMAERRFKGGYPQNNHVREFLNCVKSRQQPVAPAEGAHRSISTCHAANICVRLGRPVKWDPVKEEFPNDAEANRLVSRAYRHPWRL